MWEVGLFWGEEDAIIFGPFAKETAEELFKWLNDDHPKGMVPFIRPRRNDR
jgi:hypothetical protein